MTALATAPLTSIGQQIVNEIKVSVNRFFSFQSPKELKIQTPAQRNARKALAFANQLRRNNPDLTLSECMAYAWDEIKKFGDQYRYIKFTTVKGEVKTRLILAAHWSDVYPPKGTGRPMKPGQVGMIDAAKLHSGGRAFISTYVDRIIETF